MVLATAELPKDESVKAEMRQRQLPLFDGFEVEAMQAKIKSGDVAIDISKGVPKFNDIRTFTVKVRVAEVGHKYKKIKRNQWSEPEEMFTRIVGFEIVSAKEI